MPAATEILYALGAGDDLAGVSDDCTYPPEARAKPTASTSRLPDDLTSAQIDAAAGDLHRAGSVYHIDRDFLRAAHPDLIIAQDVCEVCAVSSAEARAAADDALCAAPVVSVSAGSLAGILDSVEELGHHCGREDQARHLRSSMQEQLAEVANACGALPRTRAFYIGWLEPLMCEGHWVPELIAVAGGQEVIGRTGEYGVPVEWQAVVDAAPEVIIVAPCSFDVPRTLREVDLLETLPDWRELDAVGSRRVFVADSAYFACPGPRIVDGARILARALHPDAWRSPAPEGAMAVIAPGPHGRSQWIPYR
ncbi:MAG TPA: ABC transporter substrate-binding protein [Dehalococcoidia bacterium]|nr:ABC transporter substrate-binding protein [Dehalococcoidia bacterium]